MPYDVMEIGQHRSVQVMACRLFGAKPVPEPVFTHFNWNYRNKIKIILTKIRLKMSSRPQLITVTSQWGDGVLNHQLHDCLLNRSLRHRSKKTSKLRVTGLCAGNSPWPVNSPHKWPVTRKMFPFDDVIMLLILSCPWGHSVKRMP